MPTAAFGIILPLALLLSGCAAAPSATVDGSARPGPVASDGTGSPATDSAGPDVDGAAAAALSTLLTAREQSLTGPDTTSARAAFARTLADPTSPDGAAQLDGWRAARALGLAELSHDAPAPGDPEDGILVRIRYRVEGIGTGERTATVRYRLSEADGGWRVVAEEPTGADAAPAWVAMPGLAVVRGRHSVVAGTEDPSTLRAAAATVDEVLPELAADWSGTPPRALVLAPATAAQAAALLGSTTGMPHDVAATTQGPLGPDARAVADRVVLDPEAWRRLSTTGRDVVLTHELVHVAVRATLEGSPPSWLGEGYADHLAYARSGLSQRRLAGELVAAVRAGDGPTDLPADADLDASTGSIEAPYQAAWQAVELIARTQGEATLRELLRACASPDASSADRRCDAAMPRVLGQTRAELVLRWRTALDALAR